MYAVCMYVCMYVCIGTLTDIPVQIHDKSVDFWTLCALYYVADVAMITSVRDGMNLVAYEYVTSQKKVSHHSVYPSREIAYHIFLLLWPYAYGRDLTKKIKRNYQNIL